MLAEHSKNSSSYEFFSCSTSIPLGLSSTNILCGLSAYIPHKLVVVRQGKAGKAIRLLVGDYIDTPCKKCLKCLWSKKNCFLFERLFKVKKNGFFLLGISFFGLEIFTFLYYANEESDDVIGAFTKTVQHSIKNISKNVGAVFFKLGTRNVHHKRNRMTPTMLLPWQHSWLQSLSVKTKYPHFQSFKARQRV